LLKWRRDARAAAKSIESLARRYRFVSNADGVNKVIQSANYKGAFMPRGDALKE
jgi:hypothetical protein